MNRNGNVDRGSSTSCMLHTSVKYVNAFALRAFARVMRPASVRQSMSHVWARAEHISLAHLHLATSWPVAHDPCTSACQLFVAAQAPARF